MKVVHGWAFPDADEFMATEMKEDGTYQASHLRLAEGYVTDWTCAVDGGAHVGTWSRLMSARFTRVIAIEPSPDTFEALKVNMAAFGCVNVELQNVALGAVPGVVSMGLDARAESLKNTGGRYVRDGGTIPRITLDSLKLQTCGFLKLDIEGSEPLAIMGARATLAKCHPIILYENKAHWRRYGFKANAMETVLAQAGYRHLCRAGLDAVWGPA